MDQIQIEILPDGTVKVTTDSVSAPNHLSAEQFLREMSRMLGGDVSKVKRSQVHQHTHHHVTH